MMEIDRLSSARILVAGLGREGVSTCRFLRRHFPSKHFAVCDRSDAKGLSSDIKHWLSGEDNVDCFLGDNYLAEAGSFDVIIRSPGISLFNQGLQQAVQHGARLSSQTDIFFANCRGTTVGITGTKGKSTTSTLVASLLKQAGFKTFLIGNIGVPALEFLDLGAAGSVFVLELSSYQLEGLCHSPHVAVLLNIFPEHLNYHTSMANYIAAKRNITAYQSRGDLFIWNAGSKPCAEIAAQTKAKAIPFSISEAVPRGYFVQNEEIVGCTDEANECFCRVESVSLPGRFNLNNVLAAIAVARHFGVDSDSIERSIRTFEQLEHRFEFVGIFKGIAFYNASLSTVPEVTIAHLDTLGDAVDTILLGGYDRNLDFSALGQRLLESGVRNLILFPDTGEQIWQAVEAAGRARGGTSALQIPYFVGTMESAVEIAFTCTAPGKACLLSPASSSYNLFRDYRERGERFKAAIQRAGGLVG